MDQQNVKDKNNPTAKPKVRKIPIIRQTATSIMRLVKANPLLVLNPENKLNMLYLSKICGKPSTNSVENVNPAGLKSKFPAQNGNAQLSTAKAFRFKKPSNFETTSLITKEHKNKPNKDIKCNISARQLNRKPLRTTEKEKQVTDMPKVMNDVNVQTKNSEISPIERKTVTFSTSTAYSRRSIKCFTPASAGKRLNKPPISAPAPFIIDLPERLNQWLNDKGKPLDSFSHLKCFNLHLQQIKNLENKENIEVESCKSSSYEDLNIDTDDKPTFNNETVNADTKQENLNTAAIDALNDLHKLIIEDYPLNQCEAWLGLIHQKYKNIDEHPQYWECRAAVEQSKGDISSAVECYQYAIVQGAEVKAVDKSLDQLLQKFSLLNISTSQSPLSNGDQRTREERAKILLDARNIFKSSIIQFAVQERTTKKKKDGETTKRLLVTPVRRSTRISTYQPNSNFRLFPTLQELDVLD